MSVTIRVEVAYAAPDRQVLVDVELPPGATVADALAAARAQEAGLAALHDLPTGIWGRVVPPDTQVADGDRVELYRPLRIDPREARRRRAAAGDTTRTGHAGRSPDDPGDAG